ncbi:MAG: hypothetical protein WCP17_03605 [bacterium]
MALRTKESQQKYLNLISNGYLTNECKLCTAPSVKDFEHWRIINNKYPYDLIAKTNHMVIPKRHTVEKELTESEKKELESIKHEYIDKEYDMLIEVVNRAKSIPSHFHTHLIVEKDPI